MIRTNGAIAHGKLHKLLLLLLMTAALQACGENRGVGESAEASVANAAIDTDAADAATSTKSVVEQPSTAEPPQLVIDADSFVCLGEMTAIRHFFVDNLLDDVEATIAVAESTDGGVYPPGSVVQLVPTEVMVKHPPGFNAATRDWEFFELDVSADGSSIRNRGFVDVVNKFGGNCFGCHIKAEPKFDLICELDHGCDPIPVTREMIAAIQAQDPRCLDAVSTSD